MGISTSAQLEYSATAPAAGLLRLPEGRSPVRETGAGGRRIRIDISRKTFTRDVARVRKALIPRGRTAVAGLTLGISTYVLYLLIQCLLPAQGSGIAVLGERFSSSW